MVIDRPSKAQPSHRRACGMFCGFLHNQDGTAIASCTNALGCCKSGLVCASQRAVYGACSQLGSEDHMSRNSRQQATPFELRTCFLCMHFGPIVCGMRHDSSHKPGPLAPGSHWNSGEHLGAKRRSVSQHHIPRAEPPGHGRSGLLLCNFTAPTSTLGDSSDEDVRCPECCSFFVASCCNQDPHGTKPYQGYLKSEEAGVKERAPMLCFEMEARNPQHATMDDPL